MNLTSNDPEPTVGTCVIDDFGVMWERTMEGYWVSGESADPESWIKVAGNRGPVRIVGESYYTELETP